MNEAALGRRFASEIAEQPAVWRRLAQSDAAARLAAALDDAPVLVGSGSSLHAAAIGALALRRRGLRAVAVAATETRLDHRAYEGSTVVAVSQSGRSTDVLSATEVLRPRRLVAITNEEDSPLARRADVVIGVGAGEELAIPASKSVSATAATLLWAASLRANDGHRDARGLVEAAGIVECWLAGDGVAAVRDAAQDVARCEGLVALGSDYGVPVAREAALKLKEAAYVRAEGFAAGEFRHGSIAMADAQVAALAIVDADALPVVVPAVRELRERGVPAFAVGAEIEGARRIGPLLDPAFNVLGWLVAVQVLALQTARVRGIDSDAPRGLRKAMTGD